MNKVSVVFYNCNVSRCINNATVECKSEYTGGYTGGIVGLISTDSKDPSTEVISSVSYCYNTGKVKGNLATAGIVRRCNTIW